MDWFRRLYEGRESFDNKDEERAYREKQRALTRLEVDALYRLLRLAPGARILDAYCGNGRHAIELAHRGFQVIGVDTSCSRIAFASHWARDEGANAVFLLADARALGLRPVFDAILILGGSFSHCQDERENIKLLQGFKSILRPRGLLLIDNPNPLRLWWHQNPKGTTEEEKDLRYFDLPLGKGDAFGYVRYFCLMEMRGLLRAAGLTLQWAFGDREGGSYTSESPRMIVIGKTTT